MMKMRTLLTHLSTFWAVASAGCNPSKGSFHLSRSYSTGSFASIARQDVEVPLCEEMIPHLIRKSCCR